MKRAYIATIATCLIFALGFWGANYYLGQDRLQGPLKVGFIYDGDESTLYTYNFSLARDALEKEYGDGVEIFTRSNVHDTEADEPVRELCQKGCQLIFLNGYSELIAPLAPEYPDVQFCQASYTDMTGVETPENYHTFKGEIYQGRYVTGIAAGMKLRQLIDEGQLDAGDVRVGFVAAFSSPEVISGYTAFLLGVRSVVPQAVMSVRYTGAWNNFVLEKAAAQALIDEGCALISHHSDTIGPAVACEEARPEKEVYCVSYNQGTMEVAPTVSLMATRISWTPYVLGAAEAVMRGCPIEKVVGGRIHGRDMSAGFERGWVEITNVNDQLIAPGTREAMESAIAEFRRGKVDHVFRGDYTGRDPENASDTIDLNAGFIENQSSSYPTFHYVLDGIISIATPASSRSE